MSDEVTIHPAAEAWPMLPEPDLRRLAEDIAKHGLMYPIVVDVEGRVIDGRNRLAACRIAGVEPTFETYDGDPVARVVSANNERRHLSTGRRAMATALTLAENGRREGGRWKRGSVPDANTEIGNSTWANNMKMAGVVLDWKPDLAWDVVTDKVKLADAYDQAVKARKHAERIAELPDDLRALVEAGEVTLDDALRRARLPVDYAERVAAGNVTLDEAEHLANRDEQDRAAAIKRMVNRLLNFLDGWDTFKHLDRTANRDDVLAALDEHDRQRILTIEKEITWNSADD